MVNRVGGCVRGVRDTMRNQWPDRCDECGAIFEVTVIGEAIAMKDNKDKITGPHQYDGFCPHCRARLKVIQRWKRLEDDELW
jgi:hypothetical protein